VHHLRVRAAIVEGEDGILAPGSNGGVIIIQCSGVPSAAGIVPKVAGRWLAR
jgi:hypothetical protein